MKYILVIILLTLTVSTAYAVEVEDVKIGWDGYYRTGYWCPVRMTLASQDGFDGRASLRVGLITYSMPISIAPKSAQAVNLNILINSDNPDVELRILDSSAVRPKGVTADYSWQYSAKAELPHYNNDKPVLVHQPQLAGLKSVRTDEFLIGVEKNIFEHFSAEFTSQSDAFKKSRLFPFTLAELPPEAAAYESVDLLVFSSPILDRALQQTLDIWQKAEHGNTLFFRPGQTGISVDNLVGVKSYSANPCINPDIYRRFDHSPWHKRLKGILHNFLGIYALISTIIILLYLWMLIRRRSAIIFTAASGLLIGLVVVLLYGAFLPENLTQGEVINYSSNQGQMLMVFNQFGDKAQVTVVSGKPLYRDAEHLAQTDIHFRLLVPPYAHTAIEVTGIRPVVFQTKTTGHLYPDNLELITIKR